MSLADSVVVNVVLGRPGVTAPGFGVPLIASQNAAAVFGGDITRTYATLADVLDDFAATTPEYNAARAIFSQDLSVSRIRIGKLPTNPVTQRWQITCVSAGVNNTYIARVWNADGTFVTATYDAVAASNAGTVISSSATLNLFPSPAYPGTTTVSINQGSDQTFTWSGARGLKTGSGGTFDGASAGSFVVRVNGDATTDQTITLVDADTASAAAAAAKINALGIQFHAFANGGGNLLLESNRFGESSQVTIVSGTTATLAALGQPIGSGAAGTSGITKSAGTGLQTCHIAFMDAATPDEVRAAIALADSGIVGATLAVNGDGFLQLTTDTPGASPAGVHVKSTSYVTLGFDTAEHNGTATGGSTNNDIIAGLKGAIDAYRGQAWIALHEYVAGNFITNDTGKFYRCVVAGQSASSGGPTGTGSDITDGTVHWEYTGTSIDDAPIPQITTSIAGSGGGTYLVATGADDTVWFALEIADPKLLAGTQTQDAPSGSGLATDLTAIANSTTDWYGLITLYNSSAYVAAAAAWTETQTKLYVPDVSDTICATISNGSGTDVLHNLKAAGYARSAGFFHPRAAQFAAAAEMGFFFPIPPGDDNWRMKTLSGITSGWANGEQFSSTQTTNLEDRNANYYADIGGVSVIGGNGVVADGEYIDVLRGLDWFVATLSADLLNLLIQNNKVPFTNAGISQVVGVCRSMVQTGIAQQLIDPGDPPGIPIPTVTAPKKSQVSAANRAARILPDVQIAFVLAGAINKILVTVNVSQ